MSDPVARLNAALSGRYAVLRGLGEGGMATVYLADDVRHGRKVALKVLKPELAAIVGAERFLAEIRTTASLQHPHILPLFDSGEADGLLFYVMPLIEGESLRDRLDREHQLPVAEAVRIAMNVAEALDYAHRHGVIHRDIKPANILLHDGKPVVSDFGIALAVSAGGAGRLTETGLSLGTPHYMSPEQATGDASVGAATDVWALGCALYEMLVGEPPYTGSTPQAVLGKIITAVPPSAVEARKSVPPHVDAAIRKALEKVPADRFGGAGAFSAALGDPGFRHGEMEAAASVESDSTWRRMSFALGAVAIVLAVVAASAVRSGNASDEVPPRVTLTLTPPTGVTINANWGLGVSPDGRTIVYFDDVSRRLFRRDLGESSSVPIPGTESSWKPFFSPDGASIAFFDDTQNVLKRVGLDGSGARTLADVPATGRSGGWSEDGTIVFMSRGLNGLSSVAETGGEVRPVTRGAVPDDLSAHLYWFDLLPGGTAAVGQRGIEGTNQVVAVDLETGTAKVLFLGLNPRYESGHLLYGRDDAVWAAPFDVEALETTGPPILVAEGVDVRPNDRAIFEVTEDVLVYAPIGSTQGAGAFQPVWIDRQGNREPLDVEPGNYAFPRISPDGRRVALVVIEGGNSDIIVYDLESRVPTRLTFEPSVDWGPVWTLDGSRIVFRSNRDGALNLYSRRADGLGEVERLTENSADQRAYAFTPEGALLYTQEGAVWVKPRDAGAQPARLTQGAPNEVYPTLAPNGRFLALQSDESGPREVFVHSFPEMSGKLLVSTLDIAPITGAINADPRDAWSPVWSGTGRELYYQSGTDWLVRVPVGTDGAFTHGNPAALLEAQIRGPADGPHFDVTRDGERFLVIEAVPGERNELIVVQNWRDVLGESAGN